ncbi:uncharacterized protein LOC120137332 [Hibiscus syriacus]|uniref:uncharacterized protein LOC120137332 n=1 Tax=Hibiscus syriacus TaxID=106335 RepID=UPI0019227BC8|nr:uncharacterized protein LOC120137332 [Hibiscus syriacus]
MEDDTATYGCVMFLPDKPSSPTLQILAFETAKNMSRLVALYKSLTDEEFSKLRYGTVKSAGVEFLNSTNETYLLGLACKEKLEDLHRIAAVVSRLSKRCVNEELTRFEAAYQNMMKQGVIDISNLDFNSKNAGKIIEKMEKYANVTSLLYTSLAALDELELSEKRIQRSKSPRNSSDKKNIEKQIRHFKHVSLWNKKIDKIVALMARIICTVYARICVVFGIYLPSLLATVTTAAAKRGSSIKRLCVSHSKGFHMKIYPEANLVKEEDKIKKISKSGPILIASKMKRGAARFISSELSPESKGLGFLFPGFTTTNNKASNIKTNVNQKLIQSAPENTVGAAGLAFGYANIIIKAENYFRSMTIITDAERKDMFDMLPINLKQTLRVKLRGQCHKDERERRGLAEWWKEALAEIIGRLAPVAHDTLRWQQERNLEQQTLVAKRTVLLFPRCISPTWRKRRLRSLRCW